ncbi:MAG: ORF6N domain-containing protein [Candidatus Omnitrophica bacterium]|nr:ORF6N domain-containing protein [Candidatus Omnitrophota bacterium]
MNKKSIVFIASGEVESRIFLIRGQRVMVDRDLAELYGVGTKVLNQAVNRNEERFPDFMFRLSEEETKELVTNCDRFKSLKHSTVRPRAFTEHGVAMLASVLKSERAVKISIHIVKTFIRLREFINTHKELAQRMKELEEKVGKHDKEIIAIVEIIKRLISEPEKPKGKIGFHQHP